MDYRIRLTLRAVADAEDAHGWMAEHLSPLQAARWYVGLFDAIESLRSFPHRCPLAPEADAYGEPIRQLLYGKRRNAYRILYVVRGEVVQILRVWHSARQWLKTDEIE
jgi:plasmid stabilization system protein ParE